MKHLIRFFIGLVLVGLIIALGLLYHFQLWEYLVAALALLIYPTGWFGGRLLYPPEE